MPQMLGYCKNKYISDPTKTERLCPGDLFLSTHYKKMGYVTAAISPFAFHFPTGGVCVAGGCGRMLMLVADDWDHWLSLGLNLTGTVFSVFFRC